MKYFFSKYDQIRSKLRIWSHLLKKFFIFCVMKDNFITVTLTLTICKIYYDDDYHQTCSPKFSSIYVLTVYQSSISEVYPESCQACKIERFAKNS